MTPDVEFRNPSLTVAPSTQVPDEAAFCVPALSEPPHAPVKTASTARPVTAHREVLSLIKVHSFSTFMT
jgi:hypothetical protein